MPKKPNLHTNSLNKLLFFYYKPNQPVSSGQIVTVWILKKDNVIHYVRSRWFCQGDNKHYAGIGHS
jgi:hypothetical protein